jgi:predicted anti-sigma-YlaC factor YlaD
MSIKHLTDEEIQLYLDECEVVNRDHVERHLQFCDECRNLAAQYHLLYDELKSEPSFHLRADFKSDVLARIPDRRKKLTQYINTLIYSLIGAISLFLCAIYIDWKAVLQGLSITGVTFCELASALNKNFMVFASAMLVLSLLMLFDKIIILPRQHRI